MTSNLDQKIKSLKERFPHMTEDELFNLYSGYIDHHDDEAIIIDGVPTRYSIVTSFSFEFPDHSGISCHDIGRLLKVHGVATKGVKSDHEYSCCYFYFRDKKAAESFARRLAKFICARREIAKKWGLFTGEGTFSL